MEETKYHFIGKDFPRKEGVARVTGKEVYPSDLNFPGMLQGKILRSPYPHAKIKSIDIKNTGVRMGLL